ncbi:glutamate synthase-related protein [Sphaerisporangium corydalis]|uniref:Glutamate synthase-related protein n=1 Tax=Sphaerisporangium corydalis TaxID=1441875 RepID=A0ABV9EC30_9ACTN|nr:glutamate synthase-related protein [Sphaerisporangium corydalis]
MSGLSAPGLPEGPIRARARDGVAGAFPPGAGYGHTVFGATPAASPDPLDRARLAPPIFMPERLEKLIELGREPTYGDVVLDTVIGGLSSPLPVYVSALGSTEVAGSDLGLAVVRQAGRLGLPLVVGENVGSVGGYRSSGPAATTLLARIEAYAAELRGPHGGVVVQQSTEDADSEIWNLLYSDPAVRDLLDSGRMAFELKCGQGAKPGLGGMTMLDADGAARVAGRYVVDAAAGGGTALLLRSGTPGTFTEEILRQQIRLMRNNYPRARVWVKLPPVRDVRHAAVAAWSAGADAVTVDGAEAGTGWAPVAFLEHVGLPLGECLARLGSPSSCVLVSGRMWEGARAVKSLALGATAVGLGRAALVAADEAPRDGLVNLVACLAFEMRMLISALGKYAPDRLGPEDVWAATGSGTR